MKFTDMRSMYDPQIHYPARPPPLRSACWPALTTLVHLDGKEIDPVWARGQPLGRAEGRAQGATQPSILTGSDWKRPNCALLDQGGAARGVAGPASALRALPWEARPGRTPGHASQDTLIKAALRTPARYSAGPSSSLPIVQLAATASMAALRGRRKRSATPTI